jgi:hypothetical protein
LTSTKYDWKTTGVAVHIAGKSVLAFRRRAESENKPRTYRI